MDHVRFTASLPYGSWRDPRGRTRTEKAARHGKRRRRYSRANIAYAFCFAGRSRPGLRAGGGRSGDARRTDSKADRERGIPDLEPDVGVADSVAQTRNLHRGGLNVGWAMKCLPELS